MNKIMTNMMRRLATPRRLASARRLCSFATPELQTAVTKAGATTIDLRTDEEIAAQAGPSGSMTWDFRNDESLPASLPEDKSAPVILF